MRKAITITEEVNCCTGPLHYQAKEKKNQTNTILPPGISKWIKKIKPKGNRKTSISIDLQQKVLERDETNFVPSPHSVSRFVACGRSGFDTQMELRGNDAA